MSERESGWYRVTEVREGVGVVQSHRGQRGSRGGTESQRSERESGW
jgi:hypothetical protein